MGVSITFHFLKMVLNSLLGAPFSEHLTEPHIHVQSVKACGAFNVKVWVIGSEILKKGSCGKNSVC